MNAPVIILGIDPGSLCTGYGLVQMQGPAMSCLAFGQIRTQSQLANQKLHEIWLGLNDVMARYSPAETVIEKIFTCHNHQSALKLGQARGVALAVTANHHLPVFEYTAKQIKKAVSGYGAASKKQIQSMVVALLKLRDVPPPDAADALAIAICHGNQRKFNNVIKEAS
jgi:crossover junction endodeoxyribonuclease RuvC